MRKKDERGKLKHASTATFGMNDPWIGISEVSLCDQGSQENASSMVSISGRFNDRSPCPVAFDVAHNSSLIDVMGIDSFNEFQCLF